MSESRCLAGLQQCSLQLSERLYPAAGCLDWVRHRCALNKRIIDADKALYAFPLGKSSARETHLVSYGRLLCAASRVGCRVAPHVDITAYSAQLITLRNEGTLARRRSLARLTTSAGRATLQVAPALRRVSKLLASALLLTDRQNMGELNNEEGRKHAQLTAQAVGTVRRG